MNEAELQRMVAKACKDMGLEHYHTRNSKGSEPGFPDSVIVGPGGILFRELKSYYGQPTAAQARWGRKIVAAGGDWGLWRPADWHSGAVEELLRTVMRP